MLGRVAVGSLLQLTLVWTSQVTEAVEERGAAPGPQG